MIGTFFKLVGKAMRMAIHRPIQRFNIFSRVKKYLGPDSKYFMPAPRAIGALSQKTGKPIQYPHLERGSEFKSVYSGDNDLVISNSTKLPTVVKTLKRIDPPAADTHCDSVDREKPKRPLPTSTNLQLSDPAVIWHVEKVPPGRLDLSKVQELLINKLADDAFWTSKKIAETYNIKEEYAENLIKYFKQIRIIISPRMATALDYVARSDPAYQSTKHIIYQVDKSLRSEYDKQFDKTFLPTDELQPEVRELLDADTLMPHEPPHSRLANIMRRPQPLRIEPTSEPVQLEASSDDSSDPPKTMTTTSTSTTTKRKKKRLTGPINIKQSTTDSR